MAAPRDIAAEELRRLLGEVARLREENAALREEVARLKGLSGRPKVKPLGMERATAPEGERPRGKAGRTAGATECVVQEEQVLAITAPPGSRFKGHEGVIVQDLRQAPRVIRYRRQRWRTPDGRTLMAPLPVGVRGHFGPELRRFVLLQPYQGQVGVTAQLGDDRFTAFATRSSKSHRSFLEVLRADHKDYVANENALAHMRAHGLAGPVVDRLAAHPTRRLADQPTWRAHLEALGLIRLEVTPDAVKLATEAALRGSPRAHGLLKAA